MAITRWVHLFKRGENKPRDGRESILVDDSAAAEMEKNFRAHGGPLDMNYVHAPFDTETKNLPFPDRFMSAAKIKDVKWGQNGFYVLSEFTDRASHYIASREMDAASAEVLINRKTRKPYRLLGAALCNRAALALEPIRLSEKDSVLAEVIDLDTTNPETNHNHAANHAAGANNMSHLSQIAVLLGASEDESPEVLAEKGVGLLSALTTARDEIAAAVGLDGKTTPLAEIGAAVKAQLLATKPDMSGFIALTEHTKLLTEADTKFTALSEQFKAAEASVKLAAAEDAIRAVNTNGEIKITPAMKPFAIKLFQRDPESFKEYADQLPVQLSTNTEIVTGKPADEEKPSQGNLIALAASKTDPTIRLVESPKGKE